MKRMITPSAIFCRHQVLVGAMASFLILGLINYILFQPNILILRWLDFEYTVTRKAPKFFTSYFSDLTWCLSLCLFLKLLTNQGKMQHPGQIPFLMLPFLHEFLQWMRLVPGTFDWGDLLLYGGTILFFHSIFSFSVLTKMKRLKERSLSWAGFIFFFAIAIACATPNKAYTYKPPPCVKHKALNYSPILLRLNISGSYTMKDLSGAQRSASTYIMDIFNNINPYKYQIADGVQPNMTLNITFNTDSYQHYGATLYGTVYDGSFNSTFPTNYVTPEKLLEDIASRVDGWVRYGWCNNCPSPCDPNN